jgi:hypothetical protein
MSSDGRSPVGYSCHLVDPKLDYRILFVIAGTIFSCQGPDCEEWVACLDTLLLISSIDFVGLHALAWNVPFRTRVEQKLYLW